jgi:hypothetical protein
MRVLVLSSQRNLGDFLTWQGDGERSSFDLIIGVLVPSCVEGDSKR